MKRIIRILALVLAMATALTLIGCHQKDETVLTIGDVQIPSGLYLAFQMDSYNQFMDGVNQNLSASSNTSEITKYADYFNQSYDGKTAVEYINENTIALATEYALIQQKFKEYGLELDKDQTDYIDSYAKYNWDNGEKNFYEPNGVGYESYKKLITFRSMKSVIFEYYYGKKNAETGKGGLYTVADADLVKTLGENYILADTLTIDLVPQQDSGITEYTAEQIATFKADLQTNVDKYNKGTSFADIYKEVYGQEPQSNVQQTEDLKTIYPTSAVVYSESSSDATLYTQLKTKISEDGFKYETAYLVGSDADKQYSMAIVYDITKDPYYLEQYRSDLLYLLKEEEFTKKLADEAAALEKTGKMKLVKNDSLIKYYDPTNLDYDSVSVDQ